MIAYRIIERLKEFKWVSPMVVLEKKIRGDIRICVALWKLNDACVHDPFPTLFIDEVLENVGKQEAYSFTDGFLGYHQIKIVLEDRRNIAFATEWGSFQYIVTPFGLKNSPAIFSRVVVATFKDFIHKFLEVHFGDWTMFGLVKKHVSILHPMLNTCRKYQIYFNLKKCISVYLMEYCQATSSVSRD